MKRGYQGRKAFCPLKEMASARKAGPNKGGNSNATPGWIGSQPNPCLVRTPSNMEFREIQNGRGDVLLGTPQRLVQDESSPLVLPLAFEHQ